MKKDYLQEAINAHIAHSHIAKEHAVDYDLAHCLTQGVVSSQTLPPFRVHVAGLAAKDGAMMFMVTEGLRDGDIPWFFPVKPGVDGAGSLRFWIIQALTFCEQEAMAGEANEQFELFISLLVTFNQQTLTGDLSALGEAIAGQIDAVLAALEFKKPSVPVVLH